MIRKADRGDYRFTLDQHNHAVYEPEPGEVFEVNPDYPGQIYSFNHPVKLKTISCESLSRFFNCRKCWFSKYDSCTYLSPKCGSERHDNKVVRFEEVES